MSLWLINFESAWSQRPGGESPRPFIFDCNAPRSAWTLKNQSGVMLPVESPSSGFQIDPRLQSGLICGNAVGKPQAVLRLTPKIEVQKTATGYNGSFEQLANGGFRFWLSDSVKKRSCEITCEKLATPAR